MIGRVLVFIICIFLVAFPKGGIKVGGTPITFGYILLLLYTFFSVLFVTATNGARIYVKKARQYVLLCCLPFQLYSAAILLLSENMVSFGYILSFVLSIIIMPVIFLFAFNRFIDLDRFELYFNPVFKNCIRFVAVFGIILFIIKYKTGKEFEIPFLTVNLDDVGTLSTTKYNMRGNISKLVSTYNNGNIYGVSLTILLPLYLEREKSTIFKSVVILSLILTLSRTVWAGLILYLIIYFISKINNAKGWIILAGSVIFIMVAAPLILNLMHVNISFLFDKNLGGRAKSFNVLRNVTFFGSLIFKGVNEIVYTSIIDTFGILGLILFIIYLFSPGIIYLVEMKMRKPVNRSTAYWGVCLYWFLCFSDGAMLFIPVMAFYWFISSYIFRLLYSVDNTNSSEVEGIRLELD
jgi:hypothetical protein